MRRCRLGIRRRRIAALLLLVGVVTLGLVTMHSPGLSSCGEHAPSDITAQTAGSEDATTHGTASPTSLSGELAKHAGLVHPGPTHDLPDVTQVHPRSPAASSTWAAMALCALALLLVVIFVPRLGSWALSRQCSGSVVDRLPAQVGRLRPLQLLLCVIRT